MLRGIGFILGFMLVASPGPQVHPLRTGSARVSVIRGRIVLYDWFEHETTSGDDIVVKTTAPHSRYVRIIYKPLWGFDAPSNPRIKRLDRLAFVGRGPILDFKVHAPETREQISACSSPLTDHVYKGKTGTEPIPRFVPTPGASKHGIPPVSSLPCFILNENGLKNDTHQ